MHKLSLVAIGDAAVSERVGDNLLADWAQNSINN